MRNATRPAERLALTEGASGFIVDGDPDTPMLAGTCHLDSDRGIVLTIPFMDVDHPHMRRWIDGDLPAAVLFRTNDGDVSLFEPTVIFSSRTLGGNGVDLCKLAFETAALGQVYPLSDALMFSGMQAQLDGLAEWTGLSSLALQVDWDEKHRPAGASISTVSLEPVEARTRDLTIRIRPTWTLPGGIALRPLEDLIFAEIESDVPQTLTTMQEPLFALETLLELAYRHRTRITQLYGQSDSVAFRDKGDNIIGRPWTRLLLHRTVRDEMLPTDVFDWRREQPLFKFGDIPDGNLSVWFDSYPTWGRLFFPVLQAITGPRILENIVLLSAVTIERVGHLRLKRGRRSFADYSRSCLDCLDVPWGALGWSSSSLADLFAEVNNAIKHPERPHLRLPEAAAVAELMSLVARAQAFELLGVDTSKLASTDEWASTLRTFQGVRDVFEAPPDDGRGEHA